MIMKLVNERENKIWIQHVSVKRKTFSINYLSIIKTTCTIVFSNNVKSKIRNGNNIRILFVQTWNSCIPVYILIYTLRRSIFEKTVTLLTCKEKNFLYYEDDCQSLTQCKLTLEKS